MKLKLFDDLSDNNGVHSCQNLNVYIRKKLEKTENVFIKNKQLSDCTNIASVNSEFGCHQVGTMLSEFRENRREQKKLERFEWARFPVQEFAAGIIF